MVFKFSYILIIIITGIPFLGNSQALNTTKVVGEYSNYDYAYKIHLPEGFVAYRSSAPNPNHGFGAYLDKAKSAYLWVDASYNTLLWQNLEEAIDSTIAFLKNESNSDIVVLLREPARLDSLSAYHSIVRYKNNNGVFYLEETLLAPRRQPHGDDIVHSINLRTPESMMPKHKKLFNQLGNNFVLQRLPK
ncbi:MAG: hypothetical protein WAV76_13600 [Bacteroidota bacterium]